MTEYKVLYVRDVLPGVDSTVAELTAVMGVLAEQTVAGWHLHSITDLSTPGTFIVTLERGSNSPRSDRAAGRPRAEESRARAKGSEELDPAERFRRLCTRTVQEFAKRQVEPRDVTAHRGGSVTGWVVDSYQTRPVKKGVRGRNSDWSETWSDYTYLIDRDGALWQYHEWHEEAHWGQEHTSGLSQLSERVLAGSEGEPFSKWSGKLKRAIYR